MLSAKESYLNRFECDKVLSMLIQILVFPGFFNNFENSPVCCSQDEFPSGGKLGNVHYKFEALG